MAEATKTMPLAGVKVIDLSTAAAAPISSVVLADWGADVIKVEAVSGDMLTRLLGATMNCPFKEDDNICWEILNRNKRGIAVDMKTNEGKEIIHKLLVNADVMITNFRPDALKRLDMNYESVSKKYPRLIYAYLNGYGDKGPDMNKPGFDLAAYFVRSGISVEFGEPDTEPLPPVAGFGDTTSGTFLAGGICAALINRARTNKGCKVQIALFSAAIWNLALDIAASNNTEGGWSKPSRSKPRHGLLNSYKTSDGRWLTIMAVDYDRYWKAFCTRVLRMPELMVDQRFGNILSAITNAEEQAEIIRSEIERYPLVELVRRLTEADIVYEVCQRWNEIKDDPQAIENNFIMQYKLPSGRVDWITSNPIKFNGEDMVVKRGAPGLGEHGAEVLREVGYSQEQINVLREKKVVL